MGFIERLSRATVTGDMSMERSRIRDADYVAALGMAGAANPTGAAIADSLLRGRSLEEARRGATRIARNEAKATGVTLTATELYAIGSAALHVLLHPACPRCKGRGYKTVPGTPALSGKPCERCRGTGRREIGHELKHRDIAERVLDALYKNGLGAINEAKKKLW